MQKVLLSIVAISALLALQGYIFYTNVQDEPSMNILLIGDVGTGNNHQQTVAQKLNDVGQQHQSKFVLSFGDNFYEYGLEGLDDPKWESAYADIYPKMSYLKDLPWLGVIGNHDYRGEGLFSEFEYKKNNWRIDSFFWTHTEQVGSKRAAFIHIDTSFLAYGPTGEIAPNGMHMKQYFKELGWKNDDDVLAQIEEQLIMYQDYDWIMVMGHHHIGYSCPTQRNTGKIYDLLQKYRVDAYFNGHSHTLAFAIQNDMGMIVSGAGGKSRQNECAAANPYWSKGYIFGFVDIQLYEDRMEVEAHYIDDDYETNPSTTWQSKQLPTIMRRDRS